MTEKKNSIIIFLVFIILSILLIRINSSLPAIRRLAYYGYAVKEIQKLNNNLFAFTKNTNKTHSYKKPVLYPYLASITGKSTKEALKAVSIFFYFLQFPILYLILLNLQTTKKSNITPILTITIFNPLFLSNSYQYGPDSCFDFFFYLLLFTLLAGQKNYKITHTILATTICCILTTIKLSGPIIAFIYIAWLVLAKKSHRHLIYSIGIFLFFNISSLIKMNPFFDIYSIFFGYFNNHELHNNFANRFNLAKNFLGFFVCILSTGHLLLFNLILSRGEISKNIKSPLVFIALSYFIYLLCFYHVSYYDWRNFLPCLTIFTLYLTTLHPINKTIFLLTLLFIAASNITLNTPIQNRLFNALGYSPQDNYFDSFRIHESIQHLEQFKIIKQQNTDTIFLTRYYNHISGPVLFEINNVTVNQKIYFTEDCLDLKLPLSGNVTILNYISHTSNIECIDRIKKIYHVKTLKLGPTSVAIEFKEN